MDNVELAKIWYENFFLDIPYVQFIDVVIPTSTPWIDDENYVYTDLPDHKDDDTLMDWVQGLLQEYTIHNKYLISFSKLDDQLKRMGIWALCNFDPNLQWTNPLWKKTSSWHFLSTDFRSDLDIYPRPSFNEHNIILGTKYCAYVGKYKDAI